jgi:hypothetical protein
MIQFKDTNMNQFLKKIILLNKYSVSTLEYLKILNE